MFIESSTQLGTPFGVARGVLWQSTKDGGLESVVMQAVERGEQALDADAPLPHPGEWHVQVRPSATYHPLAVSVALRCLHLGAGEPWPAIDALLELLPPDERALLRVVASYRGTLPSRQHPRLPAAATEFADTLLTGAGRLLVVPRPGA